MHIFIDETGSFSGVGKFPSPSLVGALIIPDAHLPRLEKRYRTIRKRFPKDDKGEVKGRSLGERQVAEIASLLLEHGALFEAALIDLGIHTEAGLALFIIEAAEELFDAYALKLHVMPRDFFPQV
jgi:hypothetical protein